ncbi:hypothetical protein B0H13DRAFT_2363008 [Mycena leptocephala]|nr:hypothetical protein B0H13DRAFT_2363008 [Mycena leptocephala]
MSPSRRIPRSHTPRPRPHLVHPNPAPPSTEPQGISTVTPPIRTAVPRGTPCHRRSFLRMASLHSTHGKLTRTGVYSPYPLARPRRRENPSRPTALVLEPAQPRHRPPRQRARPRAPWSKRYISLVLAHPIHADLERTRPARVVNTGKDIGMWFGPSAAAEALRIVVEHSRGSVPPQ